MIELSIILMIVIFMFGAFLKGWAGFGTNLLVPPLLLFLTRFDDAREVMVIVVTVNIFMNLYMIIKGKTFNLQFLKKVWVLVVVGVLFNFVGVLLFTAVDDSLFRILLGLMILFVAMNRIFKLNFHFKEITWKHYLITGILSGILNGMFGLGGIPVLILLSSTKMDKVEFKSTLVSYFFVMNAIFIILQGIVAGSYNAFVYTNVLIVLAFAVGTCMFGYYLSGKVDDKLFQRVMNFVLIFFGINLIYVGVFGKHIFTIFS